VPSGGKRARGGAGNGAGAMAATTIDEDLHSRQLAVYGRESMRRLASAHVLVVGLGGLGVEIAKNVALAGVKAITLHDTRAVELRHLGAQFYLDESDVGANRAEACCAKLQELNAAVTIGVDNGALEDMSQYSCVVCTETPLEVAKGYDDACHDAGVPFVRADTRGLFASVFCDFGDAFTVFDTDGEQPHTGIVSAVTSGGVVTGIEDERLEFEDGELVVFTEVKGMTELNDGVPRKVKNCKPHSFEVDCDVSGYGPYTGGGIVTQVKQPKQLSFKRLREALGEPGEFLLSDFSKLERPGLLHVGFQALEEFEESEGRLPAPGSAEDAAKVVELAKGVNAKCPDGVKQEELDEAVLSKLALGATGELSPMAALFGGVVGQEVVKACTGKFHPIFQFFYFDSLESLPDGLTPEDVAPMGTRYDSQVAVMGRQMQEKLGGLKAFLVGAGALGCEFIKNLALMGAACEGGKLTMTDDDTIEKSNLSRQFLFRDWNIGQAKSDCAASAAKKINPALNVLPLQNRVSPSTETTFDDGFWEGLDVVVNALDNVDARLYVDSRCVYFCKPLLESGTLGTKCNTQMVIPHKTENYGASRDPPEKQAPMCTLHSFPHNIDHCLTWARSEFEGAFEKAPGEARSYLSKPDAYAENARKNADPQVREALEGLVDLLVTSRCTSYEDCLRWARLRFQESFHNKVAQLTFTFPEDAKTSTGNLFWSAPKRFPTALDWSAADASHVALIRALANLRAEVYGLELPAWAADLGAVAKATAAIAVEPFKPREGVQIETDPKADSKGPSASIDDDEVVESLLARLEAGVQGKDLKITSIEFEKDDDTNFHMDAISGLANMRARNYAIGEVDKLQAKLIAGRIIPAIATTTAMATGFVCLELYKLLCGKKLEDYRNTFANLALPLFAMAEPIPPAKVTFKDTEWSLWDRWIIKGDVTTKELVDWFEEKGLTCYSITSGSAIIWSNIFPKHAARLPEKLSSLVQSVAKVEIPDNKHHFDIVAACEDDEGEDVDVPLVSIRFRNF